MNIAETALALWTVTAETPGAVHGPWPVMDWEKIRVSSSGIGTLTLTWLMASDDTLTVATTVTLGTDIIVEVKGKYVQVTSDVGAYTARLWPGNYEGDSGTVGDDFWTFDSAPGSPTLYNDVSATPGITDIALAPQGIGADTFLYISDDGVSGAQASLISETTDGTATLQGDGDVNVRSTSSDVTVFSEGNMRVEGRQYVLIAADNGDIDLEAPGASANIRLIANGGGDILLSVFGGGFVTASGLPTVNPGGSGRVWNDSGTLKIT